jgi:hypothetical protein
MFFLGWEGRAGCGKIGEKKLNKKTKKTIYIYICLFFWKAGRGKICGKKIEQI